MHNVVAVVFDGHKTAGKALTTLDEAATPAQRIWVDDIAVLSRGKHGMVRVESTWAQSDSGVAGSVGLGALTGALIGALMGPTGAIAGAMGAGALAGGSLGTLFGAGLNLAVEDPRLEEFAARLKNDTSALVLVTDEPTAADFKSLIEPLRGEVIETKLNEHDVKALREALKAESKRS